MNAPAYPPLPDHLTDAAYQAAMDELMALDEARTRQIETCSGAGLEAYLADMWPIIEHGNPYIRCYHIDAMCDHLAAVTQGHIKDLLITIPPRHAKSINVAVAWPTWEWGPQRMAQLRWIFSTYVQTLSVRDSNKRRRVIAHPWFQQRWGDTFHLGSAKYLVDGSTRYENDLGGYHLATSVKGANTGEGGDRVICDDPHNVKDTHYDAVREETVRWWTEVMPTRRNNPSKSARVVIMQRVHEGDVAASCIRSGFHHLNLPLEYERKRHCVVKVTAKVDPDNPPATPPPVLFQYQDWRREEGELLDPVRFGPAERDQAKTELGVYAYSGQFQQNPTPAEGGIIKGIWLRYWLPEGHHAWDTMDALTRAITVPLPRKMDTKTTSWDMAFKDAIESDLVCGQVWGKVKANHYLLEYVHDHMSFTATKRAVLQLYRRHPDVARTIVEEAANGIAILDSLKDTISGLVGMQALASKTARVHAVQPLFEAGQVYLPHEAIRPPIPRGAMDPVGELLTFPNATHDDWVDSLTQALIRMTVHAHMWEGHKHFAQVDV